MNKAFDASRAEVDETQLTHEERLGLAYCRLNGWEWDELFGPKPEGWDKMPEYEYPYTLGTKRKVYPTKFDYAKPMLFAIEKILGDAKCSYYHWRFNLGKSYEEWLQWYVVDRWDHDAEPEPKGYKIAKEDAEEILLRKRLYGNQIEERHDFGYGSKADDSGGDKLKHRPTLFRRFFFKK